MKHSVTIPMQSGLPIELDIGSSQVVRGKLVTELSKTEKAIFFAVASSSELTASIEELKLCKSWPMTYGTVNVHIYRINHKIKALALGFDRSINHFVSLKDISHVT